MTVIRQEISSPVLRARCSTSATTTRWITSPAWPGLRTRGVPRRQGCDCADSYQQPHVRRGTQADLPGHGIVNAFVKVGMDVRFEAEAGTEPMDLQQMVDAGVRRAYLDPDNKLRASIQADRRASESTPRTTRRPW